jgi:hypothetical protein
MDSCDGFEDVGTYKEEISLGGRKQDLGESYKSKGL